MAEDEGFTWEGVPAGVPCWHIHHGLLLEWSTEPLEVRARSIREMKPEDEVETRLRLMRPVKGKLPAEVVEAGRAYYEARLAYDEAWRALDNVVERHHAEIEALHKQECPGCPWDGETIFPEQDNVR